MASSGARPGQILAGLVGTLLVVTMAAWTVIAVRKQKSETTKLTFGKNDEVYFFRPVTTSDAASLGAALQKAGYFTDQGASVQLMRWKGATTVTFALNDGTWNRPLTVTAFEEIGRRVAPVIGGYPIQINLADAQWTAHKSLTVGKAAIGANDTIYYFGTATDADAQTLGRALREAGYLKDLGVTVTLTKDPAVSIGFVVNESVWQQAELSEEFRRLAKRVAPAVGGGAIEVRLLNAEMDARKVMRAE
jgi:hypothetical protein